MWAISSAVVAVGVGVLGAISPIDGVVPCSRTLKVMRPVRCVPSASVVTVSSPQSPAPLKVTLARYSPGSDSIVGRYVAGVVDAGFAGSAARLNRLNVTGRSGDAR